jgi:hypothetical protein
MAGAAAPRPSASDRRSPSLPPPSSSHPDADDSSSDPHPAMRSHRRRAGEILGRGEQRRCGVANSREGATPFAGRRRPGLWISAGLCRASPARNGTTGPCLGRRHSPWAVSARHVGTKGRARPGTIKSGPPGARARAGSGGPFGHLYVPVGDAVMIFRITHRFDSRVQDYRLVMVMHTSIRFFWLSSFWV